jgi:hypothetical protein
MSEKIVTTQDRVTFSETRSVNIGDYENVSQMCSISTNVVNKAGKAVVTLFDHQSEAVEAGQDHVTALKKAKGVVQKFLDTEETRIRKRSDDWVTFDTEEKIPKKKTKKKKG